MTLCQRSGNDVVSTPKEMAQMIVDWLQPSGVGLEPCIGPTASLENPEGPFFNAMLPYMDAVLYREITLGLDFMDFFPVEKIDWIITNPPWSDIPRFLEKSLSIAENVCFLCPIANLFSLKFRNRIIKDNGFAITKILLLPTPKEPWPNSGFQLAAMLMQRGSLTNIEITDATDEL
jgi:hypothetical protein